MRSQALGLAEAVGLPIEEKRITVRAPWYWLPAGLIPMPLSALDASGDHLSPPWPRLVICCGRRAIGPALAVKRASGGRTLVAYVQNPELAGRKLDLVAAMPHDQVRGPNVVNVPTALHRVTPARLEAARSEWRDRVPSEQRPILGVLIGGDNGGYRLTQGVVARLIGVLRRAHREHGMHAWITPSRRTGSAAKDAIRSALAGEPFGTLWDGTGDNPYYAILALSERLIVTAESISMVSEALATGHPVHILPLEGRGVRHSAFLKRIVDERLVSPILDDDLDWSFRGRPPIESTLAPAARLRAMLRL